MRSRAGANRNDLNSNRNCNRAKNRKAATSKTTFKTASKSIFVESDNRKLKINPPNQACASCGDDRSRDRPTSMPFNGALSQASNNFTRSLQKPPLVLTDPLHRTASIEASLDGRSNSPTHQADGRPLLFTVPGFA